MSADSLLATMAMAMEREEKERLFYLEAASKTSDAKGMRMFRWLAEEQAKLYCKLSQQYKELFPEGLQQPTPAQLPLSVNAFPITPEVSGELDALQIGINVEKESMALYSKALAEATTPEVKLLLTQLVEEKKGHLELLEEEYEWLKSLGAYFGLQPYRFPMSG